MRKITESILISIGLLSSILIQGCAITNKTFKSDISTISILEVIRYETPKFKKITKAGGLPMFILLGPIGVAAAADAAGKKLEDKLNIPDFTEIVETKFIERAVKEIPNWPMMKSEKNPIEKSYLPKAEALLSFEVIDLILTYEKGGTFYAFTIAKMQDSNKNIIWEKSFRYLSNNFGRQRPLDEFEADNGRLLLEEINFAAETTVSDFIEHFKGGKQ